MTDEERKAFNLMKVLKLSFKENERYKITYTLANGNEYTAAEIENMFKKVENLINKQEKAIDRMAGIIHISYMNSEVINNLTEKRICTKLISPEKEEDDCYLDIYDKDACKECIKEYFMEDKE